MSIKTITGTFLTGKAKLSVTKTNYTDNYTDNLGEYYTSHSLTDLFNFTQGMSLRKNVHKLGTILLEKECPTYLLWV